MRAIGGVCRLGGREVKREGGRICGSIPLAGWKLQPSPLPALIHSLKLTPVRATLPQADRQGRAAEFAQAFVKSEFKSAADNEIAAQLAQASELGAFVALLWVWRRGAAEDAETAAQLAEAATKPSQPQYTHTTHFAADGASRADLAVKRDTVTPFWWALKTLFKVGGCARGAGVGAGQGAEHYTALPVHCMQGAGALPPCPIPAVPYTRVQSAEPWALLPLLTAVPTCAPFLQYRTLKNYRDPQYLGPRIADKLIFS